MLNLFEQTYTYTEPVVAELLGVTRQTLRNWRVGYRNALGEYPPRLTEGKEWYKIRKSRRAPVYFDPAWVNGMIEKKQLKGELK